ncbi:MAG: response regulator, partial [Pseudomonadota bacterium]
MRVLIVDDEIGICQRLQRELHKEGHEVDYKTSPGGVLEKLKDAKKNAEPYGLLLLDIRMPQIDGLSLLQEIQEAQLDLEVIIITGHGDEDKAIESIRLGAVDYLRKPISLEELHTAIFRVQQKKAEEARTALEHRILVVDDEKELCARIKRELDKEGYRVAVAYDGDEGLEYFKNNRVDLALVDIKMPRMSGLEMLKRCQIITDDFVSIIITGHGDHETAIEALRLGVFSYLRKPLLLDELVTSVNKGIDLLLLRRSLSARRRELEIETALKEQYAKNLEKMVEKRTFDLDQILDTAADGIRVVDRDFNIIRMNDTLAKMSGVSKEDALTKKCYEVFAGERCRTEGCPLTQILNGRTYFEDESEEYHVDGSKVWCLLVAKPYQSPDGELLGIIEDFRDITERKRAENKLRESEQWLSITLRSIGDAMIATDAKGLVTIMNPVAEYLTGWEEAETAGKPLEDVFNIINEQTGERAENPVDRVLREGIVVGLANDTVLIARDGTKRAIADSGAPIRDEEGEIIGTVMVFRDITESKQAEEKLKESEERYRVLVESC